MDKSIHSSEYLTFLKTLRQVRRRAGLTQVDLAELIGETQSSVSKMERGERRIDIVELRTMCRAFRIPLSEFVGSFEDLLVASQKSRRRG